jgi:hypothetical protein
MMMLRLSLIGCVSLLSFVSSVTMVLGSPAAREMGEEDIDSVSNNKNVMHLLIKSILGLYVDITFLFLVMVMNDLARI